MSITLGACELIQPSRGQAVSVSVLCVVAKCRGGREAPSGEACGSSRRGELRGLIALAAAMRDLWSQQTRLS